MKMKLDAQLIFIWKVSHFDSFWNRGTGELRNGLFVWNIFFLAPFLRHFLHSWTISSYCHTLQEVIIQGRELAERANEMSTRSLRDRRPLQTASKVVLSDLTNLSSKVEHTKRWLEDAVNFYNLLNKVKVFQKLIELVLDLFEVQVLFLNDFTGKAPFPVLLSESIETLFKYKDYI